MQSEAEEKEKMKKKATSDILAGLENNKVKVIHSLTILLCPRILDPFYTVRYYIKWGQDFFDT